MDAHFLALPQLGWQAVKINQFIFLILCPSWKPKRTKKLHVDLWVIDEGNVPCFSKKKKKKKNRRKTSLISFRVIFFINKKIIFFSKEEPKCLLKKSIHDITNFDNPSDIGRCPCKKPRGDTIICRLLHGIWLHTQREDEAYNSSLRSCQRNRRIHNYVI